MGKQRPIDLSAFDEVVKSKSSTKIDLSAFDDVVKPKSVEKKNLIQPVAPTGTKPSKTGSLPFQTQVITSRPSFLTQSGQELYKEQVKDYKPPVQKQPALPKAEKPLSNLESIKNTVYNVANSLKGVLPRLSLTSVDVFEKVLGKDLTGKLTSLPRIEFSSDGVDVVTGRTPEQIRNESIQSLDYLGTKTKPTAGIVENARNFNIPGLAAGVVDAAGGLVSTIIPSALSGGSLLVTEMVGGGLYDYNTAKAKAKGVSTEELYKRGDADFGVPASIGGVGYAMERIGLKGFTKAISKKLAGSGFKKALLLGTEWNKEGLTEWVQVGLDEANLALANGLSVEDAALAAADKMASVQGLEAYAKGFAGTASVSGSVRLAKRLINPKNKVKGNELEQQKTQAMQDLANDNIEPDAKEAILEALENTTEQIDDLVNIDRKETENLDDNQKIQVSELNSRLDRVESAIENPDISESTKTILGFQKEAIEKEIDKILKNVPAVPQPTFDTEESIGEEVRESNRKFQAGEIDQATWEQEQKDLNNRAENIIPVPEEAEIGKPEEVVSEDVETKKAEIDSLQEEIDLLVPEQNRLVEIVNNEDRRVGQPQSENEIKLNEIINKSSSLVDERNAIEEELAALEQQTKPKEDAIQEQAAGQVPVLTEAKVSKEVEQGKPEAEPKVIAEEGVQETKITSAPESEEQKLTESRKGGEVFPYKGEEYLIQKENEGEISAFSIVNNENVALETIPNKNLKSFQNPIAVSKEVVEKADITKPIIIGDTGSDYFVLDGNHRLTKAMLEGKDIQAYVLTPEQTNEIKLKNGKAKKYKTETPQAEVTPKAETKAKPKVVTEEGKEELGSDVGLVPENESGLYNFLVGLGDKKEIKYSELTRKKDGQYVYYVLNQVGEKKTIEYLESKGIKINEKPKKVEAIPAQEQTPAQQVEQLRADEQAALKAAIPNAEQYLTDGKVDRAKITDAKDLKKFDEIYDKYDKLITPLLPEKETSAPKQEAPKKAKSLPKPKVATRLAFKKAVDLFYDISGTEGSAKKRTLAAKRKVFLEQNPSIKYIDDNWKDISKQLEAKGLITKKGNCP